MSARLASAAALVGAALLVGAASAGRLVPTRDPDFPLVRYADSTTSVNDRCIIKGWKLSMRMTPTYVNGVPVGYCCRHCPSVFMEDPEKALKARGLTIRDPIEPKRMVPLDPALHVWMNWDLVTFASRANMERYQKAPWRWTKWLTNPVTEKRFEPSARSLTATHAGRTWWFPDAESRAQFLARPDDFRVQHDYHRD